ncbi:hypothetical protein MTO96_040757 [Rhipicephalus appendiculatus]
MATLRFATWNVRGLRDRVKQSTIASAYIPDLLPPSVESCEVLALPDALAKSIDHAPLVTTVRGTPGPRPSDAAWRLDPAILKDDTSTQRIRTRLEETITATPRVTPAAWDSLKAAWKTLLQQEGSVRKRRITTKMNELLLRMRIVQSAEVLTACTRDYLDSLQVQYDRLLRETTRETRAARTTPGEPPEADLRVVSGNGSVRITEVKRPDGTLTTDPAEIEAVFRNHFESAFREPDSGWSRPEPTLTEELYKSLRRLDEDECVTLCGPASIEELRGAISHPPVKRNLLQLAVTEGRLGLPHMLTSSKILALKTARTLAQSRDFVGRDLLLYWSSVRIRLARRGPSARTVRLSRPPLFTRRRRRLCACSRRKCPAAKLTRIPPARIVEALTWQQLSVEEEQRAKRAKRELTSLPYGAPRETQDFAWKMAWKVLPTRQRLNKWGIVPDIRCPNCRAAETQSHALYECPAAKPVWRMIAHCFGIRPPPGHKRNKGAFARLVMIFALFVIRQRRSLAEARRKPVRAAYPAVARIRRLLWAFLSSELEASGEEMFLRRWHSKFFFLREGKLLAPIIPY